MLKRLLILILLCSSYDLLCANTHKDTSYLPDQYYNTFGNDVPIFAGRLFLGYPSVIKGSPYIPETGWLSGSLMYNNIRYNTTSLKLDVHTGELIIQTPTLFSVLPVGYRISNFTIGDRKFVRIDSTALSPGKAGFYEILSNGNPRVLCRRVAILEQKIEHLSLEREFLRSDEFFLERNGMLTKIVSKRGLYELLKNKKKLIRKSLRPLKLHFRKNKEMLILKAVETYNEN